MEKEIVNVIEELISAFNAENDAAYGTVIEHTITELNASGHNFGDPDTFNTIFMFQQNNVITAIAKQFHELCKNPRNESMANFVFTNYQYLENHIRVLIESRCGGSCVADRSRTIIREYLKWLVTDELHEFDTEKDHYWLPKFGTYKEWFDYCDSLYRLYYGHTEDYLKMLLKLQAEVKIRRFKHQQHDWNLKLKGAEAFVFMKTYDERTENPLQNEHFESETRYLIPSRTIPDKLKARFTDSGKEGIKGCSLRAINKSEVENIYFETKEIYI